jgi:hypothetical protein
MERYLEAEAARAGLDAIVLVGGSSRMVGFSSTGAADMRRLGALGVACARGLEPLDFDEITKGRDLYTHAWSEDGRSFVLTTLGGRVARVREVAAAIARIADEIY